MSTAPVFARVLAEEPDASFLDVLMLQVHVVLTSIWAVIALLTALVAVPQLRRIPSAFGLHVLQAKRELVLGALWGSYLLALSTGTYLLIKQAVYDPPVSGSDWNELEALPYGLPYYYAMYAKIAIVLLMGVATFLLAHEAKVTAEASEAAGGPVDLDLDLDDDAGWLDEPERLAEGQWLEEEVGPEGTADQLGVGDTAEASTLTATRVAAQRRLSVGRLSAPVLWGAVTTIVVGLLAVGFCVTLIKYFHELSKAAVVYAILTGRGGG